MLPFSLALQRTGGIDLAADGLLALVGDFGVRPVLASLFVLSTLIGLLVPNTATAVQMAPVALALAQHLDASPYPFAMMVTLAASSGFLTPISSPVITPVSTAGNYAFGDFVKVGLPLATMVLLLACCWCPGCCHRDQPARSCSRSLAPISGRSRNGSAGFVIDTIFSIRLFTLPNALGWLKT